MSDRQLRELERALARSGDTADEARLLAHRVRAGLLHPAWLEAAARLGHGPARRVLGRFVPVLDERGLVEALPLLGRRAAVLGLVAYARAGLPAWDEVRAGDDRPRRALDLLEAWARAGDTPPPAEAATLAQAAWDQVSTGTLPEVFDLPASVSNAAARVRSAASVALAPEARWFDQASLAYRAHAGATSEARVALIPFVLGPPVGVSAPAWPEPVQGTLDRDALRAAEEAFDAALAAKTTRRRATAARKRIREKTLSRALVDVAADLGDPAAWLVARRPGRPDLTPVETVEDVALRLEAVVVRRAVAAKGPSQRRPAPRRAAPWAATFTVRGALELGERVAPRLANRPATRVVAETMLEALRAWLRSPAEGAAVAARAVYGKHGVSDHVPHDQGGAAFRLLVAACDLAAKSDVGSEPRLHQEPPGPSLLREAERAGLDAPAQWELLRRTLAAWALGEDVLGSDARPYVASERYAEGERLLHPRFGEGRVARVLGDKVEVDFEGGPRTLVHGRG